MRPRHHHLLALLVTVGAVLPAAAGVNVAYLHKLSDFNGTLPYSQVRLSVDRQTDEVYVLEGDGVRIFNPSGMEIFWFAVDPAEGSAIDAAVDETGDIFLLSLDNSRPGSGPHTFLTRCNFRGEPQERLEFTNLPSEGPRFIPTNLFYRAGRFLLLNATDMRLAIADKSACVEKVVDLADVARIDENDRPTTEIFGFDIDDDGNMAFTIPTKFSVYLVSPGGDVRFFGKPGSAPGLFGIVSGIAFDADGHLLVSDKLRNVVMVFDRDFNFITEFGFYGDRPDNLIRPSSLEIGNGGKLYVTQTRKMGVSVFSVVSN